MPLTGVSRGCKRENFQSLAGSTGPSRVVAIRLGRMGKQFPLSLTADQTALVTKVKMADGAGHGMDRDSEYRSGI